MPQTSCSLDSWGRDLEELVPQLGIKMVFADPMPAPWHLCPGPIDPRARL